MRAQVTHSADWARALERYIRVLRDWAPSMASMLSALEAQEFAATRLTTRNARFFFRRATLRISLQIRHGVAPVRYGLSKTREMDTLRTVGTGQSAH